MTHTPIDFSSMKCRVFPYSLKSYPGHSIVEYFDRNPQDLEWLKQGQLYFSLLLDPGDIEHELLDNMGKSINQIKQAVYDELGVELDAIFVNGLQGIDVWHTDAGGVLRFYSKKEPSGTELEVDEDLEETLSLPTPNSSSENSQQGSSSAPQHDHYDEDLETHTNPNGGMQSTIVGRFDLLPPLAMAEMATVLEEGAKKYAPNNWRLIPTEDHVNHALRHLFGYLATGEAHHLTHALCRVAFAIETDYAEHHSIG